MTASRLLIGSAGLLVAAAMSLAPAGVALAKGNGHGHGGGGGGGGEPTSFTGIPCMTLFPGVSTCSCKFTVTNITTNNPPVRRIALEDNCETGEPLVMGSSLAVKNDVTESVPASITRFAFLGNGFTLTAEEKVVSGWTEGSAVISNAPSFSFPNSTAVIKEINIYDIVIQLGDSGPTPICPDATLGAAVSLDGNDTMERGGIRQVRVDNHNGNGCSVTNALVIRNFDAQDNDHPSDFTENTIFEGTYTDVGILAEHDTDVGIGFNSRQTVEASAGGLGAGIRLSDVQTSGNHGDDYTGGNVIKSGAGDDGIQVVDASGQGKALRVLTSRLTGDNSGTAVTIETGSDVSLGFRKKDLNAITGYDCKVEDQGVCVVSP